MSEYVNHARKHRPKRLGGTDPIEIASDLSWATFTADEFSATPNDGYYTMTFTDSKTNDTGMFQKGSLSGGRYQHLRINEGGYYWALFALHIETSGGWGANDANLEPFIVSSAAPLQLDSASDFRSDFSTNIFAHGPQFISGVSTSYRDLWVVRTFNYDPGDGSDIGSESPLYLGLRVLTTLTGEKQFTAQIHVLRTGAGGSSAMAAEA